MAITLNGTIVSDCDTAADFTNNNSGANISGDDDFVEGTGAVGDKMSGSNELLVSDNLSGGAAGVYDFSSGGADEGAHFIGWINTKTSIQATTGLQIMFRNASGHEGSWYVIPAYFYKGGFTTRVINPAADFNTATTWTTTGNPAQLDDVSEMGFEFDMLATIMGAFNNAQVDQFVVGFGVRADVGTLGTPNTYQDMVDQDQDTSFWGWLSSAGAKGGLYIGPATGTTASWFVDSAFSVKFLDEKVAAGFYGFFLRGANTTCTWTLASISAENPTNARWSIILDSGMGSVTGGFTDNTSVWTGSDAITLNQYATLTATTIIDGVSMTQNGADLDGITVINPSTAANVAYATIDTIANLVADFQSAGTGHAVDIGNYSANTSVTWNCTESGYVAGTAGTSVDDKTPTGNETIVVDVDSGITLTINVGTGASTPSVANSGLGDVDVVVGQTTFDFTLNPSIIDYEWRLYEKSATPGTIGTVELDGEENATLDNQSYVYTYSVDTDIVVQIIADGYEELLWYDTLGASDKSLTLNLEPEDNL